MPEKVRPAEGHLSELLTGAEWRATSAAAVLPFAWLNMRHFECEVSGRKLWSATCLMFVETNVETRNPRLALNNNAM
jgi:hypothetical protein